MALPQHLIKDVEGTLTLDVTSTLPTAVTATLVRGDGSAVFTDKAGVVSTIDTVTNAAVSVGDRTVTLNSVTGVSGGSLIYLASPREPVRVKTLSGLVATCWTPCRHAHTNGVTAQGSQLSVVATAAQTATRFWDGRCAWTLDSVLTEYSAVECTDYPLLRHANVDDVRRHLASRPDQLFSAEDDVEDLMDAAHDLVLERIGARARARVYPAGQEFRYATCMALAVRIYGVRQATGDMYERYRTRLQEAIERITAIIPRDADQDGVIEAGEKVSMRGGRITRA